MSPLPVVPQWLYYTLITYAIPTNHTTILKGHQILSIGKHQCLIWLHQQSTRCSSHEVFTLPHVIHMDSTRLHWTPLDSTGFQCPFCQAKLAGTKPSPLESSPVQSSPVHWTDTGLQATFQSPVPVQWTESPVKVQWSPLDYCP